MKRKILGGTTVLFLVAIISVFGIVFSYTPKTPTPQASVAGFTYLPDGVGSHFFGTRGGLDTIFNLRVHDTAGTTINHGTPEQPILHPGVRRPDANNVMQSVNMPVFSSVEMQRVANGLPAVPVAQGPSHGFVMIESNEFVVLELLDPRFNGVADGGTQMTFNRDMQGHSGEDGFTLSGGEILPQNLNNADLLIHARNNRNQLFHNPSTGSLIGVFDAEGYYKFSIEGSALGTTFQSFSMDFSFYIVHASNYTERPVLVNYCATCNGNGCVGVPACMDGVRIYDWRAGGWYFHNFSLQSPFIRHRENRFNVRVQASDFFNMASPTHEPVYRNVNGFTRWEFDRIGDFNIQADIVFYDPTIANANQRIITARSFSTKTIRLNVFGAQAYYRNFNITPLNPNPQLVMEWVDPEDINNRIGADITNHSNIQNFVGDRTGATLLDRLNSINTITTSANYIGTLLNNINPAVTNAPPVTLKANVINRGRVFFNDGRGWVERYNRINFDKDNFYEAPGEYVIVTDYTYERAGIPGAIYHQVFYFRINNLVDARIRYMCNETDEYVTRHFNDFVANRSMVVNNSSFIVFLHNDHKGQNVLGPFESNPGIFLYHYWWDGTRYSRNELVANPVTGQLEMQSTFEDGIYLFRVMYGNTHMSRMDFIVHVDTEQIQGLEITPSEGTSRLSDVEEFSGIQDLEYFEMFGVGGVTVKWDLKSSDPYHHDNLDSQFRSMAVNMNMGSYDGWATVTRFPFVLNQAYFVGGVGGFTNLTHRQSLYSPLRLSPTSVTTIHPVDRTANENGFHWQINEILEGNRREIKEFTEGGVYFIQINDRIGNITNFSFIIDDTPPGFAQDPAPSFAGADAQVNIVDAASVRVGLGREKRIHAATLGQIFSNVCEDLYTDVFRHLNNLFQTNETGDSIIVIPFERDAAGRVTSHEFSTDNRRFEQITETSTFNGRPIFTPNDNTVHLHDENFYFLRSTDVLGNSDTWYVWVNRDVARGMILEDTRPDVIGLSQTASIVRPDGIASLDFISFSFMSSSNRRNFANTGYQFAVDAVELRFYPFDWSASPNQNDPNFSPNFPFAREGRSRFIWNQHEHRANGGNFNEPVFLPIEQIMGISGATMDGLYIITRYYDFTHTDLGAGAEYFRNTQDQARNHFFIVDRNSPVPFNADPFESELTLRFGDNENHKVATWRDFAFSLTSNTDAMINLPRHGTKYGANATLGNLRFYRGYAGPLFRAPFCNIIEDLLPGARSNLIPRHGTDRITHHRFDALNLTATVTHNGNYLTTIDYINQDMIFRDTGRYVVEIIDGSGGIAWIPHRYGERVPQQIQGNRAEIRFEIIGRKQAQWIITRHDGTEIRLPYGVTSTSFLICGRENIPGHGSVCDENCFRDRLEFRFINDHEDFLAIINSESTEWRTNMWLEGNNVIYNAQGQLWFGANQNSPRQVPRHRDVVTGTEESPVRVIYTYDLTDRIARNNQEFHVYLDSPSIPGEFLTNHRRLSLMIDNTAPFFNLTNIRNADTLWRDGPARYAPRFVYAVPHDFIFQMCPTQGIRDTHRITYQEVTPNLLELGAPTPFPYTLLSDFTEDTLYRRHFSRIVRPNPDLPANETRFFRIVETDEALNQTVYYIRLRPENFVNELEARGVRGSNNLIGRDGQGRFQQLGINITLEDTLHFWRNNANFTLSYTTGNYVDVSFTRFHHQVPAVVTMIQFEDFLRQMLGRGRDNAVITVHINDGFDMTTHTITQAPSDSDLPRLSLLTTGPNGRDLFLTMTNRESIVRRFIGIELFMCVFEINNSSFSPHNPIITRRPFNHNTMDLPELGQRNIVIMISDNFGREVFVEHHGARDNGAFRRIQYQEPPRILNGIRYTGHEEGVLVQWDSAVFYVYINGTRIRQGMPDNPNFGVLFTGDGDSNHWSIRIVPNEDLLNHGGDLSEWQVVFRFRATFEIAWVEDFRFYFYVPELIFRNVNGANIDAELATGRLEGMVEVTVDRTGRLFGSHIEFTRRCLCCGQNLENISIGRWATRFILDRVGHYVITITSDVGARRTYRFSITEVDNLNFKVMHRISDTNTFEEIFESPRTFEFNTGDSYGVRQIPVFWVDGGEPEDVEILAGNFISESGNVRIDPSMNYRRNLGLAAGRSPGSDVYYAIYYLESPVTGSRMYFALATTDQAPPPEANVFIDGRTTTGTFEMFRGGESMNITLPVNATSDNPNSIASTNLYFMDVYHNGSFARRLFHGEVMRIEEQDFGVFQFHVFDWAGNVREFIDLPRRQDFFTIYNLSRPPVLINDETIIDEMIYQDELNITLMEMPQYLLNRYGDAFFVTEMRIYRDGELIEEYEYTPIPGQRPSSEPSFSFTETGRYTIVTEYLVNRLPTQTVTSVHNVNLVNRTQGLQSFTFTAPSNIRITQVRFHGLNVTNSFRQDPTCTAGLTSLLIAPWHADGIYELTFQIAGNNIREGFTVVRHVFKGSIRQAPNIVRANREFGRSHRGDVTITFNPQQILAAAGGEGEVTIIRNGNVFMQYQITSQMVDEEGYEIDIEQDMTRILYEAGEYQIVVTAANGFQIFSGVIEITEGMDSSMVFLLLGGIGVVAIGIVIFMRLRSRMRVK